MIAGHVYEHYEAPMESRRIVRLPDGSRATLEPGARLTYRASFFPTPRALTLEGEARFQARPDSDRPFDVHANGVLVRAIGTVFTVRANPWESTVHIARGRRGQSLARGGDAITAYGDPWRVRQCSRLAMTS